MEITKTCGMTGNSPTMNYQGLSLTMFNQEVLFTMQIKNININNRLVLLTKGSVCKFQWVHQIYFIIYAIRTKFTGKSTRYAS